ncbi:purine-cytosine permease family protein [Gordonia rhizosphera]|uniref:Putative NCS1 family transporter n=1 Tax=Gordonia rhizosphera NBRC 16068 TaxID=1108045 RepID=K6WGN2_9ACTN|nr:cytosine permease [Gordonia rhizosphera]GAB91292.1 putative NCS1 family transporter [Gordonia rhizosphera NBRC 16068]
MSTTQSGIEAHSFDHIPESERSGTVGGQFKFWFMVNATLITAYTGAVGSLFGLGLPASLVAIVLGTAFGTLFQAFHGAQGPHMGLPQMIQSRVQFGSRGAVVPIAVAAIVPIGFSVFYLQTGAEAAKSLVPVSVNPIVVVLGAAAGVLAIVGYHWIVRAEGIIAYVMVINLVALTVAALTTLPVGHLLSNTAVTATGFLAQFGAAAGYQIAIAPIVSDYTRYLPHDTGTRAVSAAVFIGTSVSAIWIESLGALVSLSFPDLDVISGIRQLGDDAGFALGTLTMVVAAIVCLVTAAISLYSGSVSFLSGVESFRPIRSSRSLRIRTLIAITAAVVITGLLLPSDMLTTFSVFLSLLGYLLIPWTAVNLTDYYFVRKGLYSITDILKTDGGIYGRWGRRGLAAYLVGFIAMIPFFSTSLYTGPAAHALGGADVAFVVGLAVSSIWYVVSMRSVDLDAEAAAVEAAPLHTATIVTKPRPAELITEGASYDS